MHRVVEIQTKDRVKLFITKGDAIGDRDSDPVTPKQVIGKAVFTIRKVGWLAIVVKGLFIR